MPDLNKDKKVEVKLMPNPNLVLAKLDPNVVKDLHLSYEVIYPVIELVLGPLWKHHASGFNSALKMASLHKAKVFLLFSAPKACYFCQCLEQEVLKKPDFGWWVFYYDVIPVDINLDSSSTSPVPADDLALYNKYGINGTPTAIIFNSQGTECGRTIGYKPGSGVAAYTSRLEFDAKFHTSGTPCGS